MLDFKPLNRKFLPADLKVTDWNILLPYTQELLNRDITSLEEFQRFIEDHNEVDTVLYDEGARRFIANSCDTNSKEIRDHHEDYQKNISPQAEIYFDQINKKITVNPFAKEFNLSGFPALLERMEIANKIFREENIALETEIGLKVNDVNQITGDMEVNLDGENLTLGAAQDRLYWNDRKKREEAWKSVINRLLEDKDKLNQLFDDMFVLRQQQAKNADFDNFRDYQFAQLERTDYTPEDCYQFHQAVKDHIVPIVKQMHAARKEQLGLEKLYPWDLAVDPMGRKPAQVFKDEKEFIEKSQQMFDATDPLFGDVFRVVVEKNWFDFMARPGKWAGAFNCGMQEEGVPFVLENATGTREDVTTNSHEFGHSTHDILCRNQPLLAFRNFPSEIAELASMSMELLTMKHWGIFFENKEELLRAQREHLEGIIAYIPWISLVDEFQHKIYLQEDPTIEKRNELWDGLCKEYSTGEVEIDSYMFDHPFRNLWEKQGHIYEMPFYYIEYNMAQLGALKVFQNYKTDPQKTIAQYKEALGLGYTKSIPEMYETAGASFDFSSANLQELMKFMGEEISELRRKELAEHEKNNSPKPE